MDAMMATHPTGQRHLGRIGELVVRLASDRAEIAAAQAVRHRVFSHELGGSGRWRQSGLDIDRFDTICEHLIVIDTSRKDPDHERVVGTYRLLRQDQAERRGGFYSSGEFDLHPLLKRHPQRSFLELGRSCVLPAYRSKRTLELLWQGIWAYCRAHNVDVMVGCASFPGIVPARHAQGLSFLAHHCRAQPEWDVRALPARMHTLDLMPAEAIDHRLALATMPTLIKGYLRVGARVGDGCVIDREFGTVDVFIILPCEAISERYLQHYGAEATRFKP